MGCYKSCMGKSEPRKVHIAEIKSTRNGVTYTSVYLRRTFREDGKVKHGRWAISAISRLI